MRADRKAEDRAEIRDADSEGTGRKPGGYEPGALGCPRARSAPDPEAQEILEQIVASENLHRAWKRVKANQGAPGVDGRNIQQTATLLRDHWAEIKERLLEGTYEPRAVLRVHIPKPGGGVRKLGVPTVLDRFIQQAIYHLGLVSLLETLLSHRKAMS